jgi:4-hydroxy-tetrahydrodipicolinate synthase
MPDDNDTRRAALAGVVAIPVTPFAADGSVDWDRHAALLHRLVDGGITVVTANGNTGEFYTLDPAESRLAAENTVKAVGGRASVVVGVGLDTARSTRPGTPATAARTWSWCTSRSIRTCPRTAGTSTTG